MFCNTLSFQCFLRSICPSSFACAQQVAPFARFLQPKFSFDLRSPRSPGTSIAAICHGLTVLKKCALSLTCALHFTTSFAFGITLSLQLRAHSRPLRRLRRHRTMCNPAGTPLRYLLKTETPNKRAASDDSTSNVIIGCSIIQASPFDNKTSKPFQKILNPSQRAGH